MKLSSSLTHAFAGAVAVAGFVLEPIPALDEIVMIPMQYVLAALLAKAHSRSIFSVPWMKTSLIIWGGVGVRFISESTLRPFPVVGGASNAALGLATTEILGHYINKTFDEAAGGSGG